MTDIENIKQSCRKKQCLSTTQQQYPQIIQNFHCVNLLVFSIHLYHRLEYKPVFLFLIYAEITVISRCNSVQLLDCCNQNTQNLASCCSLLTYQKILPLSGSSVDLLKRRHLLLCHWEIRNITMQTSLSEFHERYLFFLTKNLRPMTTDFL